MSREMLKLRKGDTAIMIKADGSIEMAGLQGKELITEKGHISPTILFAAAWARKDEKLLVHLVKNFQECVREGYFGADAQSDFKEMEVEQAKEKLKNEREPKQEIVLEPTETPEETAKREQEEAHLQAIADKGQDPRVKRQQEALKKGATKTSTKDYDKHKQPDLPVEQTMKYLKTTPAEQKKMKKEEKKKKQIVGTASIEEKKDNETT
tara:strand:- start:11398 stop:12024 length:627 start_codon:yes stop_codon:yes gene_type:complete